MQIIPISALVLVVCPKFYIGDLGEGCEPPILDRLIPIGRFTSHFTFSAFRILPTIPHPFPLHGNNVTTILQNSLHSIAIISPNVTSVVSNLVNALIKISF